MSLKEDNGIQQVKENCKIVLRAPNSELAGEPRSIIVPLIVTDSTDAASLGAGSKELSIVARNKSLAKGGRGILSFTEEEDLRLNELLCEDAEADNNVESTLNENVLFKWTDGAHDRLQELDVLLQMYRQIGPEFKPKEGNNWARLKKINKKLSQILMENRKSLFSESSTSTESTSFTAVLET